MILGEQQAKTRLPTKIRPGSAVAAAAAHLLFLSPRGRAASSMRWLRFYTEHCTMKPFKRDGYYRGLPTYTVNTETSRKP